MSQLFMSSGKKKGYEEQLFTLQNLSPQKYGKAAYANLTYTPSKLADNVLFKQVSNQKRLQEGTSKLRQTQTLNSIFQDRLSEIQQQKQGIEKTLGQQITMYKKILKEKQEKNQRRVKLLQQSFNNQIKSLLKQKQEEAKFAQSQKQILEDRIAQLQQTNGELTSQLDNFNSNHDGLRAQYDRLQLQYKELTNRSEQAQQNMKKTEQKLRQQLQGLKRHIYQVGIESQKRLEKEVQEKERQVQNLQRLHRIELEKVENKRSQQLVLKNQQLKDLAATFEKQTARLNGIICKKQEQMAQINRTVESEKQKNFASAKGYQNQITSLTHDRTRLKQDLLKTERRLQKLTGQHQQLEQKYNAIKNDSHSEMSKLQKDLQMNQIYYMGEVDKLQYALDDSTKQMVRLKVENQTAMAINEENNLLNRQVRNMKELLIESSDEMQRCKEEFLKVCRERDILTIKLRQMGIENQTLYIIKNSREEEARSWRDTYFVNKSKY